MKNGHQTHQTLILLITMSGELCLNATRHFNPSQNTVDELKKALQTIWDDLPQNSVNKAILSFVKRLRACVKAWGGHFGHVLKETIFAPGFELLASCDSLKCQISMFSFDFNKSTMMKIVIFIVTVLHGSVVV